MYAFRKIWCPASSIPDTRTDSAFAIRCWGAPMSWASVLAGRGGIASPKKWVALAVGCKLEHQSRWVAQPMAREQERRAAGMGNDAETVTGVAAQTDKARKFRLLFCGDKCFPAAFSRTRESLGPHPNILVETVPDEDILHRIHEFDMCVIRMARLTSDILSRAKRMKVITQFGMGLEGIDIEAATRLGIKVARIPSTVTGNALSCAEHAIYLMLGLLRDQKGIESCILEKKLGAPLSQTLFNKTVLIIGYGSIGRELAPRLKPFGVRVLAVRPSWNDRYPPGGESQQDKTTATGIENEDQQNCFVDLKGGMEHLHDFKSQADIVVLTCTLTPKTRGMVNDSFLASMKKGALLVNVARGGLMDYDAVTAALASGQLGGLGTDVTWVEPVDPQDPILQHPKVLVTPHVAGVTDMSYGTMGQIVATSAVQLYEGQTVTGLEFVN